MLCKDCNSKLGYLQAMFLPIEFEVMTKIFLGDIFLSFDKLWNNRSSHQRCSTKKGVLRNFAKFTGKHLYQRLFFDSLFRPATLLKKRFWHTYFPVKFAKFLRASFFTEHLQWLLLKKIIGRMFSSIEAATWGVL